MATCIVTATTLDCSSTTTTNTINPGTSPASDRTYVATAGTSTFTGNVQSGALVDGFGLFVDDTDAASGGVTFTNNGIVQVDSGNAPIYTGAALGIDTRGGNIDYSGTGDVLNFGTTGSGLLLRQLSGTGNITANVGGNLRSAFDFTGLFALHVGTTGNIDVTTAAGTSIQGGFTGIWLQSSATGNVTLVNNAAVSSISNDPIERGIYLAHFGTGAISLTNTGTVTGSATNPMQVGIYGRHSGTGSVTIQNSGAIQGDAGFGYGIVGEHFGTGAVSITNSGQIGALTGRASNAGIYGYIANTAATDSITINGTGAIFASGNGIFAENRGTGGITVNYTGAINSNGDNGIEVVTGTGPITITAGPITSTEGDGVRTFSTTGNQVITVAGNIVGDPDGIHAVSNSGNITVNVTGGNVTGTNDDGIQLSTSGASIVNIAAGRTVSGDYGIYATDGGTLTVNNSGTITATIDAILSGDATTLNNNAGGTVTGYLDLSEEADTVNNSGTINLASGAYFGGGNDVVTNRSGGILNLAGDIEFDLGLDTFNNNSGGTINLTADTRLLDLETFNQNGRINLNTYRLAGTGVFTNGATGFIDTSGSAGITGFTAFNNAGTIDLAAGIFTVPAGVFTNSGTIFADEGATTITGQSSFTNSGTISLRDGAANDVLTINSNFVGTNGSVLLDVGAATSDRLVINGSATGTNFVDVNLLTQTTLLPTGILLVDTTTSTANAFVLGNVSGAANPLIDYRLDRVGNDFFFNTQLGQAAFEPLALARAGGSFWYQSADEVISRTRLVNGTPSNVGFWGTLYGSVDKSGGDDRQTVNGVDYDVDSRLDTGRRGAQLGVDFGLGQVARAGVTAGYGWAESKARGSGDFDTDGYNVGAYLDYGAPLGLHGSLLAKHDRFDVEVDGGLFDGRESDGRSTGVDGEIGFGFAAGSIPSIAINAGLSHVRTRLDAISAFGFTYDYDRMSSTRGRAGIRANFAGAASPFIDATVYREFDGDGDLDLVDGTTRYGLSTDGKGSWVRVEGGLGGGRLTDGPVLVGWVEAGDRKGAGIRAGFRF